MPDPTVVGPDRIEPLHLPEVCGARTRMVRS